MSASHCGQASRDGWPGDTQQCVTTCSQTHVTPTLLAHNQVGSHWSRFRPPGADRLVGEGGGKWVDLGRVVEGVCFWSAAVGLVVAWHEHVYPDGLVDSMERPLSQLYAQSIVDWQQQTRAHYYSVVNRLGSDSSDSSSAA